VTLLLPGGMAAIKMIDDSGPCLEGACIECKTPVQIPAAIAEGARLWNLEERVVAEREQRHPQYLRLGDLICCESCIPIRRKSLERDAHQERFTTEIYLRDLFAGRYNPNTLRWLREHGHGKDVTRVLNEEGTRKANEQ